MNTLLTDCLDRVRDNKRITFGDVRRLQRGLLPDGLMTREEAEALIALDRAVPQADPAWADYLVAAVVDFVVWGSRPTGYVDADTAAWLVGVIGETPTRTGRRIAREVVLEAERVDGALTEIAAGYPRRAPVPAVRAPAPLAA